MQHCAEVRLDISPECHPDIVANMADLPAIGPFDAVYSAHSLEHLLPHEVGSCLSGVHRVLKPGGVVIIRVPDLEGLSPTGDVLYLAGDIPVCAVDLFYGWRPFLKAMPHMAHRTGFMQETLRTALEEAGFKATVVRIESAFELFAMGVKH